eukprot:CAMPEP_0178428426 /NCGR_PEP_ID=MMETSP0689_2-20121128/30272_1 /TAXON_ID=160604 /ORGANISM="Amphidinium massartii, Strain CS-259" /LENGTH=231 /DNA_ID=CAMNT_0020050199 /DNA_START=49 /DNA_END=741 /DNA_ORIENTATION=-
MGLLQYIWYKYLMPSSSTQDLKALQGMIDHANSITQRDYLEALRAYASVKRIRAKLDADLTRHEDMLSGVCKEYIDSKHQLLLGEKGRDPASVDCLKAQGNMKIMTDIGNAVSGCGENTTPGGQLERYPCGGDHDTLICVRQLEEVLDGAKWHQHNDVVKQACGSSTLHMSIEPPRDFQLPEPGADAAEASESATSAVSKSAVTPSMILLLEAGRKAEVDCRVPSRQLLAS